MGERLDGYRGEHAGENKADSMAMVRSGRMSFLAYETADLHVRLLGSAALVTGKVDRNRLSQDTRHAVARLLRDRGFAAITIVTLALGIGANTAVFSLVQTVMLRPLPYADPDRVVVVSGHDRAESTWLSLQEVVSYGNESQSLAAMAGYQETEVNLTGGQEPERVHAASVTPNLFDVLQVPALVGRAATPADTQGGTSDVVVLSHRLWQRRFGGEPGAVGQSIQLNGRARTVIGVMPPSFRLPMDYLA